MPIEIVAKPTDWLVTDQERWAAFLETETGKRLLPCAAESAPQLLAKGELNEILIRSGEVRGYQNVLQNLITMAHPSASSATIRNATEYPSLTDDSQWNDGNKLEVPKNPEEPQAPTQIPELPQE
jgi:hypothetical protein